MDAPPISEKEFNEVVAWVDGAELSRPKKHLDKDFNDGVLLAELVEQLVPGTVKLSDVKTAGSTKERLQNWHYLNRYVLKKLNFQVSKSDIQKIVTNSDGTIERVLKILKDKIAAHVDRKKKERPKTGDILAHPELRGLLSAKDKTIEELKETIRVFDVKIRRMEELLQLKDSKIEKLLKKLELSGLA